MMPKKWESVAEIIPLIDGYFKKTDVEEITLTGLCLALNTNKQTLSDYQKKDEFKHVIDMAKLNIENAYEISLRKNGRSGDIFALKNFGWTDKQELEHSGEIVNKTIDLTKLTKQELEDLEKLTAKLES